MTFTEMVPVKGAAFANQADLLPAHLGLDLNKGAVTSHDVWTSIYIPASWRYWPDGRMRRQPTAGSQSGSTASRACVIARCASSAITAASIVARRRNTIPTSRDVKRNTPNPRSRPGI